MRIFGHALSNLFFVFRYGINLGLHYHHPFSLLSIGKFYDAGYGIIRFTVLKYHGRHQKGLKRPGKDLVFSILTTEINKFINYLAEQSM